MILRNEMKAMQKRLGLLDQQLHHVTQRANGMQQVSGQEMQYLGNKCEETEKAWDHERTMRLHEERTHSIERGKTSR